MGILNAKCGMSDEECVSVKNTNKLSHDDVPYTKDSVAGRVANSF